MTQVEPKTVLVVDDDYDLSTLVVTLLEEEGYKVETAFNGEQALASVEANAPDLIILDMKMPVMDGPEFVRRLHARFDHTMPIVVLTASSDGQTRADEVGADGWISKPFDLTVLMETVDRHIHR